MPESRGLFAISAALVVLSGALVLGFGALTGPRYEGLMFVGGIVGVYGLFSWRRFCQLAEEDRASDRWHRTLASAKDEADPEGAASGSEA